MYNFKNISFKVVVNMSFCCEIFTDFDKVKIRAAFVLLVIFQDEHLLYWSNLGVFDYLYILFFFLEKNM